MLFRNKARLRRVCDTSARSWFNEGLVYEMCVQSHKLRKLCIEAVNLSISSQNLTTLGVSIQAKFVIRSLVGIEDAISSELSHPLEPLCRSSICPVQSKKHGTILSKFF